MALTLLGESEYTDASNTNGTIAIPGAAVAGDLCIVCIGADDTFAPTPSGFTSFAFNSNRAQEARGTYRVLTSGDITTGTVTVPGDGNFNGNRVQIWFYSGQDTTTPINTSTTFDDQPTASDSIFTWSTITPTVDNCDILLFGVGRDSGTSWTTTPGGYTQDMNQPGGYLAGVAFHKSQTTAAATGTLNATLVGGVYTVLATITFAVAPLVIGTAAIRRPAAAPVWRRSLSLT